MSHNSRADLCPFCNLELANVGDIECLRCGETLPLTPLDDEDGDETLAVDEFIDRNT